MSIVKKLMSRPCNITTDDKLWTVSGHIGGIGGGVLVWCYDKEDAEYAMSVLSEEGKATDLSYEKWMD